ncbi:hypothetical protein ACN1C3_30190 [Pseudomonas sp. H11T01]|uniref:hypothetical protein n=1 Tax=Pseudomonas sp. H11T01 TaxID=3402749 RepID=UPI003AD36CCD
MSDIDLYSGGGGELQPYSPSQPLSPSPDNFTGVDVLSPREVHSGGDLQLFGTPLPPNTSAQQIQATLGEISGIYLSDFSKLGFPNQLIQSAIQFFMDNAASAPQQVRRQHSFSLPSTEAGDWLAESFANHLQGQNGSQQQRQSFLDATFAWLNKLSAHLNAQVGSKPTAMDGPTTSGNPLDSLTDAQYTAVIKANNAAQAQTMGYLKDLWGQSFDINLRMVNNYYASLPVNEQQALDVFSTGWIKALNTKEIILGLYKQAIGSNSLPSGGGVQAEIEEHERVMRTDRKRWNSDERMQSRYRELLTRRDG